MRSFGKCDFVGEAAFKQYTYAIVAGHISGDNQRHVSTDAQMNQLAGLGQYVKLPRDRRFDLGQIIAEILDEDL